jgi:hypothetical protein
MKEAGIVHQPSCVCYVARYVVSLIALHILALIDVVYCYHIGAFMVGMW